MSNFFNIKQALALYGMLYCLGDTFIEEIYLNICIRSKRVRRFRYDNQKFLIFFVLFLVYEKGYAYFCVEITNAE